MADRKIGPKKARSTVLTAEEEAVVVAFAYVELHQIATTAISKQSLGNLVAAVPYHYDNHNQLRQHLTDFVGA